MRRYHCFYFIYNLLFFINAPDLLVWQWDANNEPSRVTQVTLACVPILQVMVWELVKHDGVLSFSLRDMLPFDNFFVDYLFFHAWICFSMHFDGLIAGWLNSMSQIKWWYNDDAHRHPSGTRVEQLHPHFQNRGAIVWFCTLESFASLRHATVLIQCT